MEIQCSSRDLERGKVLDKLCADSPEVRENLDCAINHVCSAGEAEEHGGKPSVTISNDQSAINHVCSAGEAGEHGVRNEGGNTGGNHRERSATIRAFPPREDAHTTPLNAYTTSLCPQPLALSPQPSIPNHMHDRSVPASWNDTLNPHRPRATTP